MKNIFTLVVYMTTVLTPLSAASSSSSHPQEKNYLKRNLVPGGDFDLLNEIFENATIHLPQDYEVSERVGIATLNMNIRNIKCYNLSIGDISVAHDAVSSTAHEVDIAMSELDLTCEMNYDYQYGVLSGDGWLQIQTDGNSASSTVKFTSSNFDQASPIESTVEQCFSDVEIERMDFEGDLVSEIIEIFQGLIRNVVESAIGDVTCSELSQIGTTLVGNMVELADTNLEPYTKDLGEMFTDPLYPERNVKVPSNFSPLNLQDTTSPVSKAFNEILHFVDTSLGATISDPDGVTSTGNDLAINVMLRSLVLDEDRALTVETSSLSTMEPILFEGHDRITQFTITLNRIRIFGLDTFTRFNSFRNIGRHTIQNELTWNSMTLELDMTVDIKPSKMDDAILQDPTSQGITERISMGFTVDQVDAEASLLIVLDEEALGAMELGPLFYTENILPCLLSAVHTIEVAGLDVDPKFVNKPNLSGFVSPGLDRVLTEAAGAAFTMYSGVLRSAIPNIFQSSIRELINVAFLDSYESRSDDSKCPNVDPVGGYIDFRNFFDPKKMTYGDVPPLLKESIDDEILDMNPNTGRPRVNEVVVAPLTKAQSGKVGTLKFPIDLFDLAMTETVSQFGLSSLDIKLFDPVVENLDSMAGLIKLLDSNSTNAFQLDNRATFGTAERKLRMGFKTLFEMEGDPMLALSNQLDAFVELDGSEVWASFLAKLDSVALFSFPLQDITNLNCWLAIFAAPNSIREKKETGFLIQSLMLSAPSMNINISCTDCSSPSLMILPDVIQSLGRAGVTDILGQRLAKMGLDLVQGDSTQEYINAMLMESKTKCPHSPEYVNQDGSSALPSFGISSLSYESVETIAFAFSLAMEVATVVATEAHSSYNTNTTSSLSAQNELAPSKMDQLVDFTSMKSSFGNWELSGIQGVVDYLTELVMDPLGPSGNDMRINTLLRSSILDQSGYASISFDHLQAGAAGMEVSLKQINIIGLDTISGLNILNVLAPQTLKNDVTWRSLKFEVILSMMALESQTRGAGDESSYPKKSMKEVKINLELSNARLSTSVFLAINQVLLGSLELQSMVEMKDILPCLLSAAEGASITELELSPEYIASFSIEGFQSWDMQDAIDKSTKLLMEDYGDKITATTPKFFDSTLRHIMNNWMAYYMNNESSCHSFSPTVSETGFVDLRDLLYTGLIAKKFGGSGLSPYGNLFSTLTGFVQNLFKTDESTGLSRLNSAVVAPVTESFSNEAGVLYQNQDLFNGGTKVKVGALDADVHFRAFDARIENLDTIGNPLALLDGVVGEAHELNNTLTFGVKEQPLRFSSKLLLDLDGADDLQIKNEVFLSLELFNANTVFSTMAKIAESRFFEFPLKDVFNIHCWLATIPAPALDSRGIRVQDSSPTAGLTSLGASIGQLVMKAECTNCSSPRMSELTELLSDPAAQNETTALANALLDYVTQLMGGNFVQTQVDRLLNEASRKCPHSPDYDSNAAPVSYDPFEAQDTNYSTSYLILLGGLTIAGIIVASAIVFVVRVIVRRRHRKWVTRLPPHQVKQLLSQQEHKEAEEDILNSNTTSLFNSRDVPCLVQWAIPTVILLNIGLFLSGHLSLGATVNIEAEVAGETFKLENFFEFSIARSTLDIWNAGGRALAILILTFSGIWPYTKLLMTFVLWFMSPSSLSVSRRGSILQWLDWLAKWSMIDIFVLVISVAAFRVSIESPSTSYLPEDFYSIEMMVIPLWGLYANMLAQLVSQISSHIIIHYHRKACRSAICHDSDSLDRSATVGPSASTPYGHGNVQVFRADMEKGFAGGDTSLDSIPLAASETIGQDYSHQDESLNKHPFSRPHRGETEKLVARNYVDKLLLFSAFCLVSLVLIGCALPSFSLELFGLVGVAVEFGQDSQDATRYHSIFSVVKLLFEQASYLNTTKDFIGLGILSVLFLCTLLFVPIFQTGLLLKQWFAKSKFAQKERMAVRLEILQAWQYLEVYLVALLVSSWQLGPVSDFMINSYCENLENMFAQMVYYGVLKEEDAQCFSVTSRIENGAFFLASGAIVLGFLSTFIFKATFQYLQDEKDKIFQNKQLERCNTSVDGTSHSDDEEERGNGFHGSIHPPPVLFTDSFRWMLKPDDNLPPSSRALFTNPNNSHWSLPEATAVADGSPDEGMIKGTYVNNLDDYNSNPNPGSPSTVGSMEEFSVVQRKRLTYDEKKNYTRSHLRKPLSQQKHQSVEGVDMDHQSIPSKMSSVEISFKDEGSMMSEAESLTYSLPSSACQSSRVPPPPELVRKASLGSASSSLKKPPPPSFYRLTSLQNQKASSTADVSPFASYFDQREEEQDRKPKAITVDKKKLKKPPPQSSYDPDQKILKKAPQPMSEESDDEEFTQISIEDSEHTTDYFKRQPYSKHSRTDIV